METLWDRTRHAFEKLLHDGEKAAERVVESFEELGGVARARLEKARLERTLFKCFAELGNAVYELHKASKQAGAETAETAAYLPGSAFEDPNVRRLLEQFETLDEELKKADGQLNRR